MQNDKTYQEALDYLYSFVDYSLTRGFQFSPEKFNLARMNDLLAALGNPHKDYPIIHVAGSKGKGSVSAMCASVLKAAGYQVGFYTSPHLHDYCERIQVNGIQIEQLDLADLVDEIKPAVARIPELTTFEITTAIGFLYFSRKKANAAVVEVGLGGRLDATNVVKPVVSVITSISYDHVNVLGDTLEKIAAEKGGIIKPHVPVVVAPMREEARQVLEKIAHESDSRCILVGRDFLFQKEAIPLGNGIIMQTLGVEKAPNEKSEAVFLNEQTFTIWSAQENDKGEGNLRVPDSEPMRLTIPLLGDHQVENAATAYTALQIFRESGHEMDKNAILSGFRNVYWPARFEILQQSPILIVDSAHNRDSARRLMQTLDAYVPEKRILMIFGASEDKDIEGMFSELLPRVDCIIATRSSHPRAKAPEELGAIALPFGKPVQVFEKVETALDYALDQANGVSSGKNEVVVLATGSLFIAAAVRETWLEKQGKDVSRVYS